MIFGATVLGSTWGALLGRQMTHGRQDLRGTLAGAALGAAASGVLIGILGFVEEEEAVPAYITVSISTGLLATLLGWSPAR